MHISINMLKGGIRKIIKILHYVKVLSGRRIKSPAFFSAPFGHINASLIAQFVYSRPLSWREEPEIMSVLSPESFLAAVRVKIN